MPPPCQLQAQQPRCLGTTASCCQQPATTTHSFGGPDGVKLIPCKHKTGFSLFKVLENSFKMTRTSTILYIHNIYTSSTAQGGGGSFKNRKPIGDIGCCESGMAERSHWWTERWLELCLLEWLQWLQWSPHPQLLDVVWCTATVVVVVA